MFLIDCPQIERNYGDLGVPLYICNSDTSSRVDCSHAEFYGPMHFLSKAPTRVLPIFTLFGIFNLDCWVLVIISIISICIFLQVAAKLATNYGAGASGLEDIILVPFR